MPHRESRRKLTSCRLDDPTDRGGSLRCSRLDNDGGRTSIHRFRCRDVTLHQTIRAHRSPETNTGIVHERSGGGRKTFTVDGSISARRGRVGPRRCRALGSPTPFTPVITHYTRTTYTATIDGRVVAKGRHTIRHAALRDCFRHPRNTNRTSGGRHRGRSPCCQCLVQETRRTRCQWRQEEETTAMLVSWEIRR